MDFVVAAGKVLVGTVVLSTAARVTYVPLTQRSGWLWVAFVGALAVMNMVFHRAIGSSINPPFYTAVWFAITLAGLTPKDSPAIASWYRKAIYSVVVGTIIGWAFYGEVVPAR